MIKTCQIRVFLSTCAGVAIGNVVARHFGFAPVLGVAVLGAAFWALGNLANATIFAEKGCEVVSIPQDGM